MIDLEAFSSDNMQTMLRLFSVKHEGVDKQLLDLKMAIRGVTAHLLQYVGHCLVQQEKETYVK